LYGLRLPEFGEVFHTTHAVFSGRVSPMERGWADLAAFRLWKSVQNNRRDDLD
jgi:hypothetical protein